MRIRVVLTLLSIFIVYGTTENIKFAFDRKLFHEKGLIFVKEKNVYFALENWELHTSIDIDMVFNAAPTMQELELNIVRNKCVEIQETLKLSDHKQCVENSKMGEFRRKIDHVESLMRRLAPYTFLKESPEIYVKKTYELKNGQDFLFEDEKLAKKFPFGIHQPVQDNLNSYGVKSTKYNVDSILHNDFLQYINHMHNAVLLKDKFLMSNATYAASNDDYASIIFDFLIGIDMYITLIEQILNGVTLANYGKISPNILPLLLISRAIQQWENVNNGTNRKLILSAKEVNYTTLDKMASFKYHYDEFGKLRFIMSLSILDEARFSLFQLIPHPVPQIVGKNTIMAYIEPAMDYLLVAPDTTRYVLLSNRDLKKCIGTGDRYICPSNAYIFSNYPKQKTCEISLFNGKTETDNDSIFRGCDVRIVKNYYPYYNNIQQKGIWLYSLPFPEPFTVKCNNHAGVYDRIMTIQGTGILNLNTGCYAQSLLRSLQGCEGDPFITEGASETLNISKLIPDFKNFDLSIEAAETLKMLKNQNPYLLTYDLTLEELIRNVKQQSKIEEILETVQRVEIATISVLAFTCFSSLLYLFPETVTLVSRWIMYYICRRRTTIERVMHSESCIVYYRPPAPVSIPVEEPPPPYNSVHRIVA